MKKYVSIFIFILVFLTSCGKKEEVAPVAPQVENTPKQEINVGEKPSDIKNTENTNSEEKINTTMADIFNKGEPTTCTFKITTEGGGYDAIMYVDGKKMRYTMNGNMEGNKIENNNIIKDGYSYTWTNLSKIGWKMKADFNEDNAESNGQEETQAKAESDEMNQKVEFSCKKGVDSTKFDLPTDINFQDMGAIPQMPTR